MGPQGQAEVRGARGTADVRIQQKLDYPAFQINVDRVKAAYLGLTQEDAVKNIVTALNSSVNFLPSFWIDERNGNHYFLGAQYPEDEIQDKATLENSPMTDPAPPVNGSKEPTLFRNEPAIQHAVPPL